MKKIVNYPSEILRNKTRKLEEIDKKVLLDMIELERTLDASENGAGLAAPQIGVNGRFFGIKSLNNHETKIYINPKITKIFGELQYPKLVNDKGQEEDFLEGCLSFPDFYGTVKRFLRIEGAWEEMEEGKLVTKKGEFNGFEAIVFQHELDHLNGVVFVDHVRDEGGKFYRQIGKDMAKWDVNLVLDEKCNK